MRIIMEVPLRGSPETMERYVRSILVFCLEKGLSNNPAAQLAENDVPTAFLLS